MADASEPERWVYEGPGQFDLEAPAWLRERERPFAFPYSGHVTRVDESELVLHEINGALCVKPGDTIELHADGVLTVRLKAST